MGSDEHPNAGRWASHPRASAILRTVAWVSPIIISSLVTYLIARAVPRPYGLGPALIWFAALTVVATGVLVVVDRLARRLLPLAALLQLSLVFPDRAPSRFQSAMRTQTVEQLEERVAEIKRTGLPDDPVRAAEVLIELVAALSQHDHITRGHADRVRAYCNMIGDELNLRPADLEMLTWAGLLHDVGKIFVPKEILNKPGQLTDDEYEVIKRHAALGAELCAPLRGWLGGWVDGVGEHHERWDGRGYPAGLAGDEISLAARIVSVADVFDVITSARSYKTANGPVEARQELARCAGTHFDPTVVRAFLNISLGRLRLAMGPLSWFANLPVVGRIPLSPAAGAAAGVAATAAVLLATGVLSEPLGGHDSLPPVAAAAAEIVAVVEPTTPEPSPTMAPAMPPAVEPTAAPLRSPTPNDEAAASPEDTPNDKDVATVEVRASPPGPASHVVTVTPTPDAPVAVDDVAVVDEDATVSGILVLGNDSDADGDPLTITGVSATDGTASTDGVTVGYTPAPDSNGTQTVDYIVADSTGQVGSATVVVTVTPTPDAPVALADSTGQTASATVVVTVTPTPDAPVADDDSYVTVAGGTLTTVLPGVLANDSDEDGDTLTPSVSTPPTAGSVALGVDGSFVYTPNPLFAGTDSFRVHGR